MTQPIPRPDGPAANRLNAIERQVVDTLERSGPVRVGQMTVRWPLTRMHLPVLLERLAGAGLLRLVPPDDAAGPQTLVLPAQSAGSSLARTPFELSVRT